MPLPPSYLAAFRAELEKIAVSGGLLSVGQTRTGRRPLRVETLLRKENEGSLYKKNKADAPVTDNIDAVRTEDGREMETIQPTSHQHPIAAGGTSYND